MPYVFLEDMATADIAFEAKGKNLEELFIAAAQATTNVMVRDLRQIKAKERREILIEDDEIDMLLFNFLQEIIFYKDAEQLIFSRYDVKIRKEGPHFKLKAEFYGERLDMMKHDLIVDVKAVTLHQFEVKKTDAGWEAIVILDI
ncbi:MAG: archease [Nitrospirae bacterium]|nr:archease [Nitrospirota bacterium]